MAELSSYEVVCSRYPLTPVEDETDLQAYAELLAVDSTGVKLYGDGEWKARKHGPSNRRTWRKLHLAVDVGSGEITAATVSTNDVGDNEGLPDLLDGTDDDLSQVSGDGAYDCAFRYDVIDACAAKATTPPRRNAKIWQHCNSHKPPLDRDENLHYIRTHGRAKWKREHDYHQRSLAETAMFRIKTLFGDHVNARQFDAQSSEMFVSDPPTPSFTGRQVLG